MKNIKPIFFLLLQVLTFSVSSQETSLMPFVDSIVVNEEGVVKYITFKDNESEKPNFTNGVNVLKQFLEISNGITFVKLESKVDKIGMTHEKYQQYYNGIPVEFGIYKVHLKNQKLSSINGEFYSIKEISITPSISDLEAISKAKQHINAEKYVEESEAPTLVIFPKIEGINKINRLAYKLDIYAERPLYRADVYVDAKSGEIIFKNNKIQHLDVDASGTTLYNGQQDFKAEQLTANSYRLRQTTHGNGIQTFDLNGTVDYANAQDVISSTTNFSSNPHAVQVHWGTEQVYEYYLQKHGRNSFDDNGAILKSYVNSGAYGIIPYSFWNGSVMTYNNSTTNIISELVAIDIVGHEITHGVVQHSAGLTYSYQSGALNESFADIFGETVENHALGTNDWLGAADVYINGGALRSFSDPKSKNHPDTYLGQYWHTSSSDNFGVHKNSGVQNKWFYLLSEGGTGTNDNSYSYAVTGIGIIAAGEIAYRNLTVYLTSNSNFFDARVGAIQSAIDLYGAGSPEVIATTESWNAVGVSATSSDILDPTIPLNLVGTNFTEYNIDLSWDASTDNIGVMGYNIYQDGSFIGTSTTLNYSNSNLPYMPPNIVYDFKITAFDAAGNISGFSNIESVWVDTIDPSNPTNLSSDSTTETTTNLTWDVSTDNFGVAGYNIYEDNVLLTTVTSTSYNVTGLSSNSSYSYKITAIDSSGNESGNSNTEIVTTLAPCADGNVILTIITDPFYPEETSWDIKDASNTIITSGGNYTVANTTYTYNITLGSGYYTLNMHDTIGDGFIPPGGYTLESNVVIASGGFTGLLTNTVSTPFCIDADTVLSNSSFNLDNAVKIITIENGVEVVSNNSVKFKNYSIYSLTGAKLITGKTKRINTSTLATSIYIINLEFDKGRVVKKILIK